MKSDLGWKVHLKDRRMVSEELFLVAHSCGLARCVGVCVFNCNRPFCAFYM
jgi:hypothetical protein